MSTVSRTAAVLGRDPLLILAVAQVAAGLGLTVVAKSTSLARVVAACEQLHPDLFIADIDAEDAPEATLAGLEAVRTSDPHTKVIAIGATTEPTAIEAILRRGVSAYVLHRAYPEDLAAAIRQVFDASIFFPDGPPAERATVDSNGAAPKLTARELETLRLVAAGASNSMIAQRLWVTEQTVKFHLTNIYRKLGVANRTAASRWAHRNGLLSTPDSSAPDVEAPRRRLRGV